MKVCTFLNICHGIVLDQSIIKGNIPLMKKNARQSKYLQYGVRFLY